MPTQPGSPFWSGFVAGLDPYVPGEQPKDLNLIKLNTNENPYPPSPKVLEVLQQDTVDLLRLYPDPASSRLKQALASFNDLNEEQVFVGNGSDEVLALAFMAFFKQDKPLLFPDITYGFYKVYCKLFEIDSKIIPLEDDFSIDLNAYKQANGGIIFPNPNAPTSLLKPLADIEALLEENRDSVVIVDEAYIDFGGESASTLLDRYPNLLVIQTLSKSRSLAGIRVGFALGSAALIEGMERVKNSFNSYPVDRLAEAAAVAAVEDRAYFEECRAKVIATREWTTLQLQGLGYEVLPSMTNFLFVRPLNGAAESIFKGLRERKFLIRYFQQPRIDGYLRITIGTDDEMRALVEALLELKNAE